MLLLVFRVFAICSGKMSESSQSRSPEYGNTEIREKLVKYIKVRHVHISHINLIQFGPGSELE